MWFETNVTPTVVNDVSLLFKIKKSWLARRFCSEKDLRVVVFVSNRWRSLDVEIVGSDKKFVFVEAQSDILAPVAVVCKSKPVIREVIEEPVEEIHEKIVDKKKVHKKKKLSFGWLKNFVAYAVLFVLLVGVFIAFSYLWKVEPLPVVTSGIQPQVWLQDSVHSLDLSDFFNDPDGDVLSFSASSVDNINVEFDGSTAIFTPGAGWHGRASVTFTASDGEFSVSSNEVFLVVKKRIVPLWFKHYLPQIISGVLFMIVVVLLIVFRDSIVKFLDEEKD